MFRKYGYRQESENATELAPSGALDVSGMPMGPSSAFGVRLGPDALGVHGNEYIRNFDEA
jgi:hypothetical protein